MKLIPGTDGFLITSEGLVYDPDGTPRNTYINGDGYVTSAVKINGNWTTMGLHRLLALTFLSESRTEERSFVNHIDGDVTNNSLDNLEWVTVYENNIHAALLSTNMDKPKLVVVSPAGESLFINTTEEACSLINCTFSELWSSIKDDLLIDGWKVRYNDGPMPYELRKKLNPSLYEKVPVKLLDTITKEVTEYPTLRAVADRFNTTPSLVNQTMTKDGRTRIFLKRYLVVRISDEFPVISDDELELLRTRISRPVIAFEVNSRKRYIYDTAASFHRKNNLSKKSVTTLLRNDKIRDIGGFVFLYMNAKNVKRLEDYLSLSGEIG